MEAKEKSKDMDRIRDMEKQPVTGYLLEISDDGKNWTPYEFDAPYEANWYEVDDGDPIHDDWYDDGVADGYFKDLPDVLFTGSDDWYDRLDVDFDSRSTPDRLPQKEWHGHSDEVGYWRVRKITISGKLSDDAVKYFLDNPGAWIRFISPKNTRVKKPKTDFVINNGVLGEYKGKGGDVVIPDGITSIGEMAFSCCRGLTSVTISNSVRSIGEKAFYNCRGLTSITIPDSVTNIGNEAFDGCYRLTSVTIPDSVKSIGWGAFNHCSGLTSLTIPPSVTSIGIYAFADCSGLTSVTIPNSVTSIKDLFNGCSGLTSVTIPNSVTSIGEGAFGWCSELTSVTIPNSVTSIGRYAFAGCSKLLSITIPDSVTSIEENAFCKCSGLTSITIPSRVTNIGVDAFDSCSSLEKVKLPSRLFEVVVKDPDKYFKETPWAEKIKSGNITFDNGLETNKETGTLDSYFGTDRSVSIPTDVTTIGVGAFEGNRIIGTVTIPDTVSVISSNAFANCSGLTSITLGSGIKRIEKDAFKGVSEHITVYVPNFAMCELLIESGLPDSAIVMVGKGATRRRVALDPEEVRESEDYDEVEVDEPYRDCEVTIHSVKGDREYGMKYYNKIKWFENRHDLVHWLHCGIAGTEGAEQDHYYSMLDQLEDGKTVVDYNYEW